MKCAVVVFPGSNCDHDAFHALELCGQDVDFVWHKTGDLSKYDFVLLPGGFSYGDYLRAGAIAGFSPIMNALVDFAESGKPVLGVCNGFQVLVEVGLLPGALLRNENLRFVCRHVYLRTENNDTRFTDKLKPGQQLSIPIAHGEGRYFADEATIKSLQENNQIVFRYVDQNNNTGGDGNPNGSVDDIAGIINQRGNVMGMMPHPERAMEEMLGSNDGVHIFQSLLA